MLTPSLRVKALTLSLRVKTYKVINNASTPSLGVKGFRSINLFRKLYSTAFSIIITKLRSIVKRVYSKVK